MNSTNNRSHHRWEIRGWAFKSSNPHDVSRHIVVATRRSMMAILRNPLVLYYFHGRKDVAALKLSLGGVGDQQLRVFPRPKGRGRIEARRRLLSDPSFSRFPRPKGRGRIEAHLRLPGQGGLGGDFHGRKDVAALKPEPAVVVPLLVGEFPRPKGRGRIEASSSPVRITWDSRFPRPKGRGRIEAMKRRHTNSARPSISTAERTWPH